MRATFFFLALRVFFFGLQLFVLWACFGGVGSLLYYFSLLIVLTAVITTPVGPIILVLPIFVCFVHHDAELEGCDGVRVRGVDGGGSTHVMHGRSRMTNGPSHPYNAETEHVVFHRPGRH